MLVVNSIANLRVGCFVTLLLVWAYSLFSGWNPSLASSFTFGRPSGEALAESLILDPLLFSYDPKAVQDFCAAQRWQNDVVVHCDGLTGGVGNVRQEILSCLRWTMSVGASLILPQPRPRIEADNSANAGVKDRYKDEVSIDYLFDQERFITGLGQLCPELQLYNTVNSVPGKLENIGRYNAGRDLKPDEMKTAFGEWIDEHRASGGKGSLISFSRRFKDYFPCHDGPEFVNAITSILKPREDVLRLAATIMSELAARTKASVSKDLQNNAYMAIHLRTAADALNAGWSSFEAQSSLAVQYVKRYDPPIVYVATGNPKSVSLFADLVAPTPVVDKMSLLSETDLQTLQALSWDQQGFVDFLVLQYSQQFVGTGHSSFSVSIATSRRSTLAAGACGDINNTANFTTEIVGGLPTDYDDGLSAVFGKSRDHNMSPPWYWP